MTQNNFGYNTKKNLNTFILCWVAYFSTYIGRLNYSAVMPELEGGNIFSGSQIAAVSSAFFIFYGIGQLLSGIIGDKADTRQMVFFGLLISAVCNIGIFLNHNYIVLIILWAINGLVQSLVWSPILKIGSMNFNERVQNKFGIDMSTTVPIGTLLSYGISLLTVAFLPWHYVFLTCGLFELVVSFAWLIFTKGLFVSKDANNTNKENSANAADFKTTIKAMAISGALIMIIPIVIQGTLKDSVTQWVPTFFSSEFGSSTTFSLALTMILPIINVTGAYFANAVNQRVNNEMTTSLIFFAISAVFLFILKFAGSKNIWLSLVCMALVTNCMFAINVMLITLVPLRFAKIGRVSTIGGALNAVAYIGCGALNLVAGKLLETEGGWNNLFILWLVISGIACLFSAICIPMWKKYRNN